MVSVIIPTYNRAHTILRSVNSVLNQTYKDLELLVIDDGSTDNTKELLEQINDSRLRYIYLGANSGASNARNAGVSYASGEWIAFQDSDDEWKPEKLEIQMNLASKHPEYSMIYSFYTGHFSNTTMSVPAEPLPPIMEGDMYYTLLYRNVIGAPTTLIKKEAFLQSGGYDTTYKSLEDWEFVIRFSRNYLIGCIPECLMDAYLQDGGVSSQVAPYYDARCRMLAEYKDDFVKLGLFDTVAMDILNRAATAGVQDQVKNMMILYLQTLPSKITRKP